MALISHQYTWLVFFNAQERRLLLNRIMSKNKSACIEKKVEL